ncbi:MAG: phage integrase family protein [Okeania sp. SIO3H1]|uniref:tyrosine-type recombinase/integrase n=1 Tax=Okeania sp. SIO1I7 TaxID=2607772 RepID=UPI0013C71E02|nr:tyrosine-type recombinase/integrase [Okeania sp. SIO1I7]NEN90808.1 phage integrase family protein [Okeania sp. SIO3H1]NET28858.1 phage integrase family protein [Okeania sp. SIO1I7]
MKNKGHGKAEILTNQEFEKIYSAFKSKHHKLIWQILRYTGERISAVLQLKVSDVYLDAIQSFPHREITYRASTRKATPDGKRATRQLPISRALAAELHNYYPPLSGWLFPNKPNGTHHLTRQSYDEAFRSALVVAGLNRRGFSLHSPRRTLITRLSKEGYPLATIQQITGHKSIQTLQEYIDVSPAEVAKVLETL